VVGFVLDLNYEGFKTMGRPKTVRPIAYDRPRIIRSDCGSVNNNLTFGESHLEQCKQTSRTGCQEYFCRNLF